MIRVRLCALFAAAALAACSGRTPPASDRVSANLPYLIGPGDTMSVFVFRNPELSSSSLTVRPDGRVSMPLVPDIVAAGKTPTELAKELENKLKDFVKEPNVSVIVGSFVGPESRQIHVIGEATEPIAIPYRDQMTVLDVMIQTKGLTRFAAGNRATIIRRYNGKQESFNVRLSDLLKDGDISQNVAMAPGDTLIIPQSFF